MKTEKFRPYVRRANGREMATSIRMATRLAFYRLLNKPFFVMVQRGFPLLAIECGPSRREVERSVVVVAFRAKTFRQWSRDTMLHAAGKGRKKNGGRNDG